MCDGEPVYGGVLPRLFEVYVHTRGRGSHSTIHSHSQCVITLWEYGVKPATPW